MSSAKDEQTVRNVLAIIGSRDMVDVDLFNTEIDKWIHTHGAPDEIVSGGARGADKFGEMYANKNKIKIKIFLPDYNKYPGKYAPIARNTQIIEYSTHVLAFPSKKGRGTQDAMRKAEDLGKDVTIAYID